LCLFSDKIRNHSLSPSERVLVVVVVVVVEEEE
jgi:hypothetical protein